MCPYYWVSNSAVAGNIAFFEWRGGEGKAEKHFPCLEQSSDIHNKREKDFDSPQQSSVLSWINLERSERCAYSYKCNGLKKK